MDRTPEDGEVDDHADRDDGRKRPRRPADRTPEDGEVDDHADRDDGRKRPRRPADRTPEDGEVDDHADRDDGRKRPRRPTAGDGGDKKDDPKYVSLRVPKSEYDKLKKLRGQMEDKPDYSWVGSLALGAFVGLAAGLAFKALTKSDDDDGE